MQKTVALTGSSSSSGLMRWYTVKTQNRGRLLESNVSCRLVPGSRGAFIGWTNASLPANVDRFSEFQFLQCIAILYGRTLLPSGSIRNMWKKKATGFLQPMDVGARFGLVRDRFEGWRKYLKLWPADAAEADMHVCHISLLPSMRIARKK